MNLDVPSCCDFIILEPLFELLLKLSTVIDAENDRIIPAETEEIEGSLSSLASSCLLSLTVAWGLTPKILQALDTLITVARPLAAQLITVSYCKSYDEFRII